MAESPAPAVSFEDVSLAFDDKVILRSISFQLLPGHMKIILGASGAGKSTILRLILGLLKPDAGRIWVNGVRVDELTEQELMPVRADLGMVFQEGALFDSLTVQENVGYRLYEETRQPLDEVDARVAEVLGFVGLGDYGDRMPSELSGGQRRRVAIAPAWHLGASQSDLASLHADDIDWQKKIITYERMKLHGRGKIPPQITLGPELETLLRRLPQKDYLFPYLRTVRAGDRATEFKQRCRGLGIEGVTLHSYRYSWAQRAKKAGYPERWAQVSWTRKRRLL